MSDRCTGHCCEMFFLPYSPEELAQRAPRIIDGHVIADMVMLVGTTAALEPVRDLLFHPLDWSSVQPPGYLYTCKHFDRETRNCMIYERRPQMCRDHPHYNRQDVCDHLACTWTLKADVTLRALRARAIQKAWHETKTTDP